MTEIEKEITLQQLLEEIKINRSEITNKIDASETRLLMTIECINERVIELEKENSLLKREVEHLKRENKKNNIVIFGLNIPQDTFNIESVCQELETLLEIQVQPTDINNFYKLGKATNSPVKVEFISFMKKDQIIRNCYKLKGKNISIVHDQTLQQREEGKILKHNLFRARQDKSNVCYIKNNKLYVNGKTYSAQDLINVEEEAGNKSNSAPPTPAVISQETSQTPKENSEINSTPNKREISTKKPNTRYNQQSRQHPNQQPDQDPKIRTRSFR